LGINNTEFIAMNAEAMEFSDETFGLVYGKGILHHLDLEKSVSEIARVLKKDGTAIFMEPLGHNWFLNKFRSKTPELRTPDEHPLLFSDFDLFKKYFSLDIKLYGFTTLLSVPLLNTPFFKIASFLLQSIDSLLLSIPYFNRNAWLVLLVLRKK
jgi:SAM-dependent methyltransferase